MFNELLKEVLVLCPLQNGNHKAHNVCNLKNKNFIQKKKSEASKRKFLFTANLPILKEIKSVFEGNQKIKMLPEYLKLKQKLYYQKNY